VKYIAEYPDFEESDAERVEDMNAVIRKHNGVVRGVQLSEEDGLARIGFTIDPAYFDAVRVDGEDEGWTFQRID